MPLKGIAVALNLPKLPSNMNMSKALSMALAAAAGATTVVAGMILYKHIAKTKKNGSKSQQITVGYWNIRGLGAPLRMMVMYSGVPLHATCYDAKPKKDGSGFESPEWASVKPALKEKHPMINLPYIIDGDVIVSQSTACFLYLGRRLDMLGDTPEQLSQCEELLCEIYDLRNKMTLAVYNKTFDTDLALALLADVSRGILAKLELWLTMMLKAHPTYSGHFFVGDRASAPDFHAWEMLAQYQALSIVYNSKSLFEAFPKLGNFFIEFGAKPGNKAYFGSQLLMLPYNNKSAMFGADLSYGSWDFSVTSYEWENYSGVY